MSTRSGVGAVVLALAVGTLLLLSPAAARAHCDGMDGPVVKAAQQALQTRDVNLVLVWVQKPDDAEIRRLFQQTLAVRKLGGEARSLADTYFFESLVRIHRAGEGAPFTGLKPAGRDLGPAIPAADQALQSGNVEPLARLLTDEAQAGLREHFARAAAARGWRKDDVEGGRKYVAAYVAFIHYVERLHMATQAAAEGHFDEEPASTVHHAD
ncbi:MAG TPA: DUF6448 family protein [Polyangia bacterium]